MADESEDMTGSGDGSEWTPIRRPGFNELIGPIEFCTTPSGAMRFRFHAQDKHRNSGGVVHGGMIMSFADTALGTMIRTGEPTRLQATVQLDVHFIRPTPIGSAVEMECRILRETRSLVFAQGEILVAGNVVASANGIWKKHTG